MVLSKHKLPVPAPPLHALLLPWGLLSPAPQSGGLRLKLYLKLTRQWEKKKAKEESVPVHASSGRTPRSSWVLGAALVDDGCSAWGMNSITFF